MKQIAAAFVLCFGVTVGLVQLGQAVAEPATITEDSPEWDCVTMGNRVCGPGNDQGKPAACYDDGGVIVASWPCHVVIDANGDAQVYEGR